MTIDQSVFIPVDPDTAFALITEPERLRRWQTVAARVDLRVGGEYRWTITPGHSAVGTFTEVEPGKRVVFTWGWQASGADASTVTIILEPAEGGTTVRLIHEGLSDEAAAGHTEGWIHYLGRLKALATTGDAGADDWAAAPVPTNELISAEAALEAFNARGLDGTIDMGFAELPATTVANILNLEFLVHAWDFATARGKTLEVSPALSDYVLGLARNTIAPSMRGNSFATETIVEESAGSLDRLVAFTGRQSAGV